ncbi:MAG: hypothetical protein HC771_24755 [Synechococcales cyanobacterium CRU_2_2]|nr:hypothetical protein [Synechococcales cyanobacterium CRU_2_2]
MGQIGFDTAFANYSAPFDQDRNGDVTADELAQQITPLENAWGGYKDAGDWDRRIQHLGGTRQHLELLEIFPDYFATVDLNIPETTDSFATAESLNAAHPDNGIPDILDESLWSLDFFRRLQNADGGVRGGIESAESPRAGEVSWQESLNVFAYAADPWSSYIYAGVAARAARVLKNYDADLAAVYEESAIRAMNWAEAETPTDPKYDRNEIRDERNLAALELYLLTKDTRWNNIFLADTVFSGAQCGPGQPCADVFEFEKHDQQQAAALYARAPENLTNTVIKDNTAAAIIRAAENSLAVQNGGNITFNGVEGLAVNGTAFGWTKNRSFTPLGVAQLATPQVDALLQAYTITGKQDYVDSAVLASQFSAGANPSNTVYTTGLKKWALPIANLKTPL